MQPVVSIHLRNIRKVSELTADLNGHHLLLIGKNRSGKTTIGSFVQLLLAKRIGPSALSDGADRGEGEIVLDDGTRISVEIEREGGVSMKVYDSNGTAMKKSQIPSFLAKLSGAATTFDINRFLQSPPLEQKKAVANMFGIGPEIESIEARYKVAYETRREKNRSVKEQAARVDGMSDIAESLADKTPRDAASISAQISAAMTAKEQYNAVRDKLASLVKELEEKMLIANQLERLGNAAPMPFDEGLIPVLNRNLSIHADDFYGDYPAATKSLIEMLLKDLAAYKQRGKEFAEKYETIMTEIDILRKRIETGRNNLSRINIVADEIVDGWNAEIKTADTYNMAIADAKRKMAEIAKLDSLRKEADDADALVASILAERDALIVSAKIPVEGLTIGEDGLYVDGRPFKDEEVSLSRKHIIALQMAYCLLGDVKFLHFDMSTLDKNSAKEVFKWADSVGLQVAAERATWEDVPLTVRIIEEL